LLQHLNGVDAPEKEVNLFMYLLRMYEAITFKTSAFQTEVQIQIRN